MVVSFWQFITSVPRHIDRIANKYVQYVIIRPHPFAYSIELTEWLLAIEPKRSWLRVL